MLNRIVTLLTAALVGLTLSAGPAAAFGHQQYRDTCLGLQTRYVYDGQGSNADETDWRTVDSRKRYRCYAERPAETSSRHTEYRKRRGVLQQRFVTVFREVRLDPAGTGKFQVVPDRDVTKWHRVRR